MQTEVTEERSESEKDEEWWTLQGAQVIQPQ